MKVNRREKPSTVIQDIEITEESFNRVSLDGKLSERNPLRKFMLENPDSGLMIRPDWVDGKEDSRYSNHEERSRGDAALKSWFEYLATKGFAKTLDVWRGLLKTGHSLHVVCDDPAKFDRNYAPLNVLPLDFWDQLYIDRAPLYPDDFGRRNISHGFERLSSAIAAGQFVCGPSSCPKKDGDPCPNRGTGVCSESTERRLPVTRDFREARFIRRVVGWHDPADDRARDDLEASLRAIETKKLEDAAKENSMASLNPEAGLGRLSGEAMELFSKAPK